MAIKRRRALGKVSVKKSVFEKGDIVSVNFPFTDGIGIKVRPALVVSDLDVHKTGDLILIQITSKPKHDGFSVELNESDLNNPLPLKSYVRIYKLFVADHSLVKAKIGSLTKAKLKEISFAIKALF